MFFDLRQRVCGEAAGDRSRLNQAHMNAASLQLHAQGDAQAFEREFRGRVSTAITVGHEAEDRGALDDATLAAPAHDSWLDYLYWDTELQP